MNLTIELSSDRETFLISSGAYTRELSTSADVTRLIYNWLVAAQNYEMVTAKNPTPQRFIPPTKFEIEQMSKNFTRAKAAPRREADPNLTLEDLGL